MRLSQGRLSTTRLEGPAALSFTSLGVSTFGAGGASRSLDAMLTRCPIQQVIIADATRVSSLVKNEAARHDQRMGTTACRKLPH
jgi:hypothetical protein